MIFPNASESARSPAALPSSAPDRITPPRRCPATAAPVRRLICWLAVGVLTAATVQGADLPPIGFQIPSIIGLTVSGGNGDESVDQPRDGGAGGRAELYFGSKLDAGTGRHGVLNHSSTLTTGTYEFTEVAPPTGTDEKLNPMIVLIEGVVTIRCQKLFAPTKVRGVFHPNKPPPSVSVVAGGAERADGSLGPNYHHTIFDFSPAKDGDDDAAVYDSAGRGLNEGIVTFVSTNLGGGFVVGVANGGNGMNGGDGGSGGQMVISAVSGAPGCAPVDCRRRRIGRIGQRSIEARWRQGGVRRHPVAHRYLLREPGRQRRTGRRGRPRID